VGEEERIISSEFLYDAVNNNIKKYLHCAVWGWTDRCDTLVTCLLHAVYASKGIF
jgi:hypothetical protein